MPAETPEVTHRAQALTCWGVRQEVSADTESRPLPIWAENGKRAEAVGSAVNRWAHSLPQSYLPIIL